MKNKEPKLHVQEFNEGKGTWSSHSDTRELRAVAIDELNKAQTNGSQLIYADYIDLNNRLWAMVYFDETPSSTCVFIKSMDDENCQILKVILDAEDVQNILQF